MKLKNLHYFLEASCQYGEAARLSGLTLSTFRNYFLDEIRVLCKTLNVSLHPLRAGHLRHQEQKLRDLLMLYNLKIEEDLFYGRNYFTQVISEGKDEYILNKNQIPERKLLSKVFS